MTSNSKIITVLETIKEQVDISPRNAVITFSNVSNDDIFDIPVSEVASILSKLEADEGIIEIIELATVTVMQDAMNMDPYAYDSIPNHRLKVTSKFNNYYDTVVNGVISISKEDFAKELAKRKPLVEIEEDDDLVESVYTVTYNELTRKIVLNRETVIRELKYDSENEKVIKYLVANPNRNILKSELETAIGSKLKKPFKKIVENYGFPNNLGKVFFSFNKSAIKFNNPIAGNQINN